MKLWIFLALNILTAAAWSKPAVLVTYFDAFSGASFNNSERIAKTLETRLNGAESLFEVKLCALNTIFDQAYAQTENCLKELSEAPVLVIGLGESTCELKPETMMRNNDKTVSPDNAGNERNNSEIVPGASKALGLRYPLPQMYCALSQSERKSLELSNNAGSFVCNNTAYQMSYYHPQIQYGFIHVPANNCFNLARKTETAYFLLEKMLVKGVTYLLGDATHEKLPHTNNDVRLPTTRKEIKNLRQKFQNDECLADYFERSKASDEKHGIFFGRMN